MNAKITMVRSLGFDSPRIECVATRLLEPPTAAKLTHWLPLPELANRE